MKYPPHIYAQTVTALIAQGISEQEVVRGLARMIEKNGDAIHMTKIGRAVEQALVKQNGGKWVEIELARSLERASQVTESFSAKDHVETSINPSLIAGARITINNEEEIDLSFERKVKDLFMI